MHTITECPICKKDFMYHTSDTYLKSQTTIIDEVGNNEIIDIVICHECNLKRMLNDYPIVDSIWKSRRWNKERTEYIDLSD